MTRLIALALALLLPAAALSGPVSGVAADIYFLGEVHDNPAHHMVQAEAAKEIAPRAMVFEMLTPAQAALATDNSLDDPLALGAALGWEASGWPDFAMYYPVFAAARGATFYGAAVPREATRRAMDIGVATSFGDEAAAYGLTAALDPEALAPRLNLQMEAHCGALPLELLPAMVDIQRLRDATLAERAIAAFDATGGPVVVITGNGHARKDWGAPSYVARVRPELRLFALGQSEDGTPPDGGFDALADAAGVERPDPCDAFR